MAIRRVWQQKEDQVRSRVLVFFLADAMWKTLLQRLDGPAQME